jgi:hypothetical protein
MRTKYQSNSELIHIWANNDDSSVFKRANSVSCQYDRLFSYNTCIAEIVNGTVIFNNHGYSNSTSKHQSLARSAIHGLEVIMIDLPKYNTSTLVFNQHDFDNLIVSWHEKLAEQYLLKASRSRKYVEFNQSMAFKYLNALEQYAKFLGLEYKAKDLSALQQAAIDNDKKQKELDKIRAANRIKEQAENLELWRHGEDVRINFEMTALRVKGDQIETTKGARIPLEHAIKAWPLFKRIYDRNETFTPNGHTIHLGHYSVKQCDSKNLIVGCHTIPMLEVLGIANQLHLA